VRPSEIGPPIRRLSRPPELGDTRWQHGQRLAATRLLIANRDADGAESVELVHEALIDGWARLQQWIEVDSAFRAWQERLRGALAAWEGVQREPGALLRSAGGRSGQRTWGRPSASSSARAGIGADAPCAACGPPSLP
jgi:hypothetical protein